MPWHSLLFPKRGGGGKADRHRVAELAGVVDEGRNLSRLFAQHLGLFTRECPGMSWRAPEVACIGPTLDSGEIR